MTTNSIWQILQTFGKNPLTLNELFAKDGSRGRKFTAKSCDIYMDFSKQAINDDILQNLLNLAKEFDL